MWKFVVEDDDDLAYKTGFFHARVGTAGAIGSRRHTQWDHFKARRTSGQMSALRLYI